MSDEVDKGVARRYDVSAKLGKGAYGIVWKSVDKKTRESVAVKKIFDAFQNATDAQRTYREVVYLLQMNHDNIIRLKNVMKADNGKDIYLIFEYMETDLHAVIRANILEEIHKQYIMAQAFKALKYMHSAHIVHRDLKPANLLLNVDCLMKVADFGLARTLVDIQNGTPGRGDTMTEYVASRWYRSPEILVGSAQYGYAADLWSLGCIFAEMIIGKAVFNGSSTLNQLEVICELLGYPTSDEQQALSSDFASNMYENLVISPEVMSRLDSTTVEERFRDKFPTASEAAVKLLMGLLRYIPEERTSVNEGLTCEYCGQFYDEACAVEERVGVGKNPEDAEHGFDTLLRSSVDVDDNMKLKTVQYRDMLYGICDAHAKGSRGSQEYPRRV